MCNLHRRNNRLTSVVGGALALNVSVQLPNAASTPTTGPITHPQFNPLHHLEPQGKTRNPKVHFGDYDAWVAKYQVSPEGVRKVLWKKQLGTSSEDKSQGVATDSSGNVYISGSTLGSLRGTNKGDYDAWVAKYSPDGALINCGCVRMVLARSIRL